MALHDRDPKQPVRAGDRIPLLALITVRTETGESLVDGATCTNIGLGGLCVRAADEVRPGTPVRIELRLAGGRRFASHGHVCWSRVTLHPALFGTPRGTPEDACFGIRFDGTSTQDLLPIARLIAARDEERQRATRLRRLHGLTARA